MNIDRQIDIIYRYGYRCRQIDREFISGNFDGSLTMIIEGGGLRRFGTVDVK